MAMLSVQGLHKRYGTETVLGDISFTVEAGEFVSIVGPSGCGKTTMLRCISGLMEHDGGTVEIAGQKVNGPPPTLGVVFQDYSRSLLPWLSVRQNVELPLRYRNLSKQERRDLTMESLKSVGLEKHVDKRPWQLSGGMQQRVAIARALAYQPKLLLMDEPFASVDAQTRTELEDLMLSLWKEREMTIAFVTHDIDEAIYLGTRVLVLSRTPTRVDQVLPVDLPQPRSQVSSKGRPEFTRLRRVIFEGLGTAPAASFGTSEYVNATSIE